MISTESPSVAGTDCWKLIGPGCPLGLVTHFGDEASAHSLRDIMVAQGLFPNGCRIAPATEDDLP